MEKLKNWIVEQIQDILSNFTIKYGNASILASQLFGGSSFTSTILSLSILVIRVSGGIALEAVAGTVLWSSISIVSLAIFGIYYFIDRFDWKLREYTHEVITGFLKEVNKDQKKIQDNFYKAID